MSSSSVFIGQFVISLVVYGLVWAWFGEPYFLRRPVQEGLTLLLIPHLVHHVGMTTLVPTVVAPTMPRAFSVPVSIGDIVIIVLTIASITALRRKLPALIALLWLFSIVGSLYMIYTAYVAARLDVSRDLAAHWYVGVLYIPLLFVSHFIIIRILLVRRRDLQLLRES